MTNKALLPDIYIVCFAGGPLDGTARKCNHIERGYSHYVRDGSYPPPPDLAGLWPKGDPHREMSTPRYAKHSYDYDEVFELQDGRQIIIARYKGKS